MRKGKSPQFPNGTAIKITVVFATVVDPVLCDIVACYSVAYRRGTRSFFQEREPIMGSCQETVFQGGFN